MRPLSEQDRIVHVGTPGPSNSRVSPANSVPVLSPNLITR
ncbi:Uncharacterized protein ToN1_02670 [Aromatoleum petrolei]|nr:Uncharacterized protein ToN1_02670 [Aromatoleum petrolei]